MPQISLIGDLAGDEDYTTLSEWESNEQNSDYGAGNPAIAEISGSVAKENITGSWPRGFIIRAKAGEEIFTGAGTAILTGGVTITIPTTANTTCRIENLKLSGFDFRSSNATITNEVNNCWLDGGSNFARNANNTARVNNCIATNVTRGFDATSGADAVATNCTVVDVASGNFGFVRWAPTNCFVYADAGTGYIATTGGDYNASDDTSSPGANSLDNRTTADFADFAGGVVTDGDYETASGSALATAGDGGTFIGYALESGGTPSDDLLADDLQSLSQLSTPTIGQEHSLLADDLQSLSELSTPSLSTSGSDALLADDLQSLSDVSTPAIGQVHAISADDLQSLTQLSAPALGEVSTVDDLLADGLQSLTQLSSPAVTQVHVLTSTSIESLTELSTPSSGSLPNIDGASSVVITQNYGETVLYFNGSDYFSI